MEHLSNININGFKLASSFCRDKGYGGAAIYLYQDVKYQVRDKINKLSVSGVFECDCIECNLEHTTCIIATIYRPPKGDLTVFF